MPWGTTTVSELRTAFAHAVRTANRSVAAAARDFGISRKTGYKIFDRYKEHGLEALSDPRAGRCATPTSCRPRSRA